MKSFLGLTYGLKNFEIILVDDSNDGTFEKLQTYSSMPNLKIFHRYSREGWKGGALNFAIRYLDKNSKYALIIDADHIVENDLLEKCIQCFAYDRKLVAVQGFPVPSIGSQSNWISRGTFFRLARRNLIEFVAKEQMALPIQITGSLFMIRSDSLRAIRFSHDLTEDWELTLSLHLQDPSLNYKRILFHPFLTAHCEAPTKLNAYFKQRSRVSEGHTRGFKKRFIEIIRSPLSLKEKIELLFTGMNYAKFLAILALVVFDCVRFLTGDILPANTYYLFISSLAIQAIALSLYLGNNIMSIFLIGSQSLNQKDVLFLTALNMCTFVAMVIGSIFGLLREKGTFYKSERKKH
jgi:cellulose synthase/poly-beta-1,6-N-acetylglucosamine synthase-like glycosyltransferase